MAAKKKEPTIDEEISREERRGGDVEVDLTEPDEDDEQIAEEGPPQAEPGTRKQKKQARGSLRQEADELRERSATLERELLESRAREAAAAGYAQGMRQAVSGQGKDPIDTEIEAIDAENERILGTYNALAASGKMSDAQAADFRKQARELHERRTAAVTRRTLRDSQPHPQQVQQQQALQFLSARHPEVMGNRAAFEWADGRYRQLVAEGAPHGPQTVELAMNEAKARLQGTAPRQTDPNLERKYQAQPRGAGPSAGGDANRMVLTKKDQEMADEAFGYIKDAKERYKAYAKLIQKSRQKTA